MVEMLVDYAALGVGCIETAVVTLVAGGSFVLIVKGAARVLGRSSTIRVATRPEGETPLIVIPCGKIGGRGDGREENVAVISANDASPYAEDSRTTRQLLQERGYVAKRVDLPGGKNKTVYAYPNDWKDSKLSETAIVNELVKMRD